MRVVAAILLLVLLAGCLGGRDAASGDARPSSQDDGEETPTDTGPVTQAPEPESGLFMADPGGMSKVAAIPGLTAGDDEGVTTYSWNVLETVEDNSIQLILMQVFENSSLTLRLDSHVKYDDVAFPGAERRTPPAACFGTSGMNTTGGDLGAYYLDRALDIDVTMPDWDGRMQMGPGAGHGNAAAGPLVNADYTFDTFDVSSGDLAAGGWMLYANGISQVPAAATQQEGNHWFVNWTVDVPHRIIHIPAAPYFCYFGFGETQGASVFIEQPYPYIEESTLEIETRYGSTAVLVNQAPDPLSVALTADNQATVTYLGKECKADAETSVVQASFKPGTLRVDVGRWAGYPTFSLTGLGPGQAMFAVIYEDQTCTPP